MAERKTTTKRTTDTRTLAEKRAANKARKIEEQLEFERNHRLHDEIGAIVCIAIGIFLIFALQTTKVGVVGTVSRSVLLGVFGRVAYGLPYLLCVYGALLLFKLVKPMAKQSLLLFGLIFLLVDVADAVRFVDKETFVFSWEAIKAWYESAQSLHSGGAWGMAVSTLLVKVIGAIGTYILSAALVLVLLLLTIRKPISEFAEQAKAAASEKKKEHDALKAQREEERTRLETGTQLEIDTSERYNPALERKKKNILSYVSESNLFRHKEAAEQEAQEQESPELPKESYEEPEATEPLEPETPQTKYGIEEPTYVPPGMGLVSSEEAENVETRTETVPSGGYTVQTGDLDASDLFPNERKTPETRVVTKDNGGDAMAAFAGRKPASEEPNETEKAEGKSDVPVNRPYRFPPVSLLTASKPNKNVKENNTLLESSRKLEAALKTFNVTATVTNVTKGPTVTRYELQPQPGVKVSQIKNLADDIALILAAKSIRIEAPIPGKSAVGVEIENEQINTIFFRECVESREFQTAKSKLSAAIGKDIGGTSIVCNLKDMPHLLIAGATGAGKSVCVNSIIMSILYKAKPEEVKLILIDPKKVELSNYNGIPHLLMPVVTDTSKAAGTLSWCVAEMMRRYQLFADEGVRDRQSYNEAMMANEEPEKVLPFILIVIDELADLMMAAGKQVEPAICRIGQLARAAGIHMVIATQSPRVDVITGLIKANIPSRIALMCSQRVDSMVILDEPGAEKLVGKGDMLFLGPGASKPTRIQGCFISDNEINNTVEYITKNNVVGAYSQEIQTLLTSAGSGSGLGADSEGEGEGDASLLQEAIQCVVKAQACSVSMLQRKFRIGYNHAARLVDAMEARGIIGPQDGTRPRKVLMTEDKYNSLGSDGEES